MTDAHRKADGVHRLLDMLVEEVSLVDRAANKHRFLVVKREDDMSDKNEPAADSADPAPASKLDDSSPLAAALSALESLTQLVELLGSNSTDEGLAGLAQDLRAVAEQLLVVAESGDSSQEVEARAKGEAPASKESKQLGGPALESSLAAAKQAVSRLDALVKSGAMHPPAASGAATADASNTTEALAKMTESLRELTETVKEQQQRLGRVEKQFGLPNSAAPAERVEKGNVENVGWPLDLNKPMDRASVDKSTSFHDP